MAIAPEVLHSLDMAGMPPHRLRLRLGAVVILIRTLSPQLCNGTRLIVGGFWRRQALSLAGPNWSWRCCRADGIPATDSICELS
ncbi:TPA: hypothetical protein N0F65_010551 [Lagenidium giganteum]|uniref:DNA helicase Pif1-like 2B domain-containing protein n=1 Tax=Lagenidium giganteum TaxID=4803 RepID=A0AAV2YI10_9STRA|nr:TPA: hypothetical protein N0F65_010551 [Lagenidium giganteum]